MTFDELNRIKRDIASFADDEYGVIDDGRGGFLFERNGQEINIKVFKKDEESPLYVVYNKEQIPYRTFISKQLANMDLLASRMLQYNPDIENFVNSDVEKISIDKSTSGKALEVLLDEAGSPALVGTKVSFVTADAGHGKSVLLRHLQHVVAEKYLKGEVNYLFWHIDLHGRDLVRLNEAIMFEVNKLRFNGLFYSTILTLMRRRLIVIGIDGFDELAAEIGGETALSSLANLMSLMEGRGTLIAASRRAFFNSQDYLKRTGLLKKNLGGSCEFNEIRIKNWKASQCKQYLELNAFDANEYEILVSKLGESHPLIERPYLFTKLVGLSYETNVSPSNYLQDATLDNINDIIEAFVRREVQKWTAAYDSETGAPYLSYDQHIQLLSEVAMDMWNGQRDIISTEYLQLLLSLLIDEWKIDEQTKPKVLRLVESHALLIVERGKDNYRRFDHEEFKNFFLAKGLSYRLITHDNLWLHGFLSTGQLPDSVSQYLVNELQKEIADDIVDDLVGIAKDEWKPSYIHTNIGTLIPFLLNYCQGDNQIIIEGKVVFSSLVFENKTINNVVFKGCSFVNISLQNLKMNNVKFENCTFTDLKYFENTTKIKDVVISGDCKINMVSVFRDADDVEVEYSPEVIMRILQSRGFSFEDNPLAIVVNKKVFAPNNEDYYRSVKRVLNKYAQTGCLYESTLETIRYNNTSNPSLMINDIVPLLIKYNIIEEVKTKRTTKAHVKAWTLNKYEISEVLMSEEDESSSLFKFWEEVRNHM